MDDTSQPPLFLGFDTSSYPGDDPLQRWLLGNPGAQFPDCLASPFNFSGYYLKGPCHHNPSWQGKWKRLVDLGKGLAIIYVGQQAPESHSCSRTTLTAAQGVADAADACVVAAADKLPAGTLIFLDIEHCTTSLAAAAEYVASWTRQMLEIGQYGPALYCHAHNATGLWNALLSEYLTRGITQDPLLWVAGGLLAYPFASTPFTDDSRNLTGVQYSLPLPSLSGVPTASIWQAKLDTTQAFGGVTLPLDIDVSMLPDPSNVLAACGVQATFSPTALDFRPPEQRMDWRG